MSDINPRPKETPATLFGAALMAVGGLMAVLCGLCSLAFAGVYLYAAVINGGGMSVVERISLAGGGLATIATVGGVPILIGALIFVSGRRMRRRGVAQAPRNPDQRN